MGDNGEVTQGDTPHGNGEHDSDAEDSPVDEISKGASTSPEVQGILTGQSTVSGEPVEVDKASQHTEIHLKENKPDPATPETAPKSKGLRARLFRRGRGSGKRPKTETKKEDKGENGVNLQEDKRRKPSRIVTCIFACCCVEPVE